MRWIIRRNAKLRGRQFISFNLFTLQIATILVVLYALLENTGIAIPLYSPVKQPMLYTAGICLLPQLSLFLKALRKRKNFAVIMTVFGFCILAVLSMKINQQNANVTRNTLRLVLYLLELFVIAVSCAEKGYVDRLIKNAYAIVAIVVVVTDLLVFTKWITFQDGRHVAYLIGTKFNVVYANMSLTMLCVLKDLRLRQGVWATRTKIIVFSILTIIVSVLVDCMTGLIGMCLYFILLVKVTKNRDEISVYFLSPTMITMYMIGSVVFAFVIDSLLTIPFVRDFVTQILGRSITLTGRLNIFAQFLDVMEKHWLWGYGIGNSFQAASSLFGSTNVQNALLEWVFKAGLLIATTLAIMIVLIFKRVKVAAPEKQKVMMPVVLLIYTYVIMGMVEITFDMSFLLWLALLFAITNTQLTINVNCLDSGDK